MTRSRILYRSVALLLFGCALVTVSPACGLFDCVKDEDSAVVACDRVTEAVNGVLADCGVPAVDASVVCDGEVCDRLRGCTERVDVDACVDAIGGLSCTDAQNRSYAGLLQCEPVFQKMVTSCASSDGDSDWDDWD
jgi:hypothetical protein